MDLFILSFLIFALLTSCDAWSYAITGDEYNVAGTPMQFNITVSFDASPLRYNFYLTDNVTQVTSVFEDQIGISENFVFPNTTKPGTYRLELEVWLVAASFKLFKINGKSFYDFSIRNELDGTIDYEQENLRESAHTKSYLASYEMVKFSSKIDDFHNVFTNVTYSWFINDTQVANVSDNELIYTFFKTGPFVVRTEFEAISKDNLVVSGQNQRRIELFEPLVGLNLTGIPNISWKRNKQLNIYVNFVNGTKPYSYCYEIFSSDTAKLICNDPDETTQDYFKVVKRFSRNGTYYLKIKAYNLVTKLEKSFPISVIDFEKKSQIIFIVLPFLACVVILSILMISILYMMRKRSKFETEVADFNFEARSQLDLMNEMTFFERLKSTFKTSLNSTSTNQEEFERLTI